MVSSESERLKPDTRYMRQYTQELPSILKVFIAFNDVYAYE